MKEFRCILRENLELSKLVVTERRICEIWRRLDADSSGFIDAGEFGRFMKKGQPQPGESPSTITKAKEVAVVARTQAQEEKWALLGELRSKQQQRQALQQKAEQLMAQAAKAAAKARLSAAALQKSEPLPVLPPIDGGRSSFTASPEHRGDAAAKKKAVQSAYQKGKVLPA